MILWASLFLALALWASPTQGQETPSLNVKELIVPSDGGSELFSLFGRGLELFQSIELIPEDRSVRTDGIRIGLERTDGTQRDALIRTSGAQGGRFRVRLTNVDGRTYDLDLVVIVEAAAIETPRIEPAEVVVPQDGGKAPFSLLGDDVGEFATVDVVAEDGFTRVDGISAQMGRVGTSRWDGSIQTIGAEAGRFMVQLTDRDGAVHELDMVITVEGGIETPRVDASELTLSTDGDASFLMVGDDVESFVSVELVAEDGFTSTSGIRIGMRSARGQEREVLIRAGGAEAGRFIVRLTDDRQDVHDLDLAVILEAPAAAVLVGLELDREAVGPGGGNTLTAILDRPAATSTEVTVSPDDESLFDGLPSVIAIEAGQDRGSAVVRAGMRTGQTMIVGSLGSETARVYFDVVRVDVNEAVAELAEVMGVSVVGHDDGARITSIVSSGWASGVGLEEGHVLTSLNGVGLTSTPAGTLYQILALPGATLGGDRSWTLQLGSPLGFESAEVLSQLGITAFVQASGIRIESVGPAVGTPVDNGGFQIAEFQFQSGDLVLTIDGSPAGEGSRQLSESSFSLGISRQGMALTVTCTEQSVNVSDGMINAVGQRPVCFGG